MLISKMQEVLVRDFEYFLSISFECLCKVLLTKSGNFSRGIKERAKPNWENFAHMRSKSFDALFDKAPQRNLGSFSDGLVLLVDQNSAVMVKEKREQV